MSTPIETNTATAPVIEVPPKDETPAVINVDDHVVNTETTTAPVTTREPTTTTKVTPAQRLNSVFTKARQTVTDAVSDAQKALSERKTNNQATTTTAATTTTTTTAAAVPTDATTITTGAVVNSAPEVTDKKAGGPNNTFKGILNRVKGLKPATTTTTTTHPTVAEPVTEQTTTTNEGGEAPVPPPKDNAKANETNPVLEQFKRNTTLLSNYLLQKKKEFTEKKSSDTNQQQQNTTASPELHSETVTGDKPTTNTSPLVRRITQLVHNATASINKKKKTETDNADIVPPTVVNASPAVTSAA
ncbi:hypothetical protein MFLAVUS_007070 [Mucor flavus]|uniref:Uncharacterized protein n=1 Tax=Mucor flavus TaxID=439312 RepID=A0ABP9Z393_9FUNG